MSYDSFTFCVSLNDHEFLLKFNTPCLIVLCESTSGTVHINMSVTYLFDNYYSEWMKYFEEQKLQLVAIPCFTCIYVLFSNTNNKGNSYRKKNLQTL